MLDSSATGGKPRTESPPESGAPGTGRPCQRVQLSARSQLQAQSMHVSYAQSSTRRQAAAVAAVQWSLQALGVAVGITGCIASENELHSHGT